MKKSLDKDYNKDFDGVIAIGGGSVMDLAKLAMAHLAMKNKNVLKLIKFKKKYNDLFKRNGKHSIYRFRKYKKRSFRCEKNISKI